MPSLATAGSRTLPRWRKMPTTYAVESARSTGAGRQIRETVDVSTPDGGTGRSQSVVGVLSQTFAYDDFTDGGAAVGTAVFTGSVPAGAVLLGSKILVPAGFAGDVSAVITVGDGSDVDRYHTGTPDIFTTAAAGVESGVPSGSKLLTAANSPTLTVTTNADFTSVSAGSVTVSIYYIQV